MARQRQKPQKQKLQYSKTRRGVKRACLGKDVTEMQDNDSGDETVFDEDGNFEADTDIREDESIDDTILAIDDSDKQEKEKLNKEIKRLKQELKHMKQGQVYDGKFYLTRRQIYVSFM